MPELKVRPWLSIWIRPKQTVREIINTNVKYRFFVLSLIYGLPIVFRIAQNFSLGGVFTLPAILLLCLILAPLIGSIGFFISTALITWTGKWLGGKGSFPEVRCAVSWTNATNLITVLIWLFLIFQFRQIVFYEGFLRMPMTVSESVWIGTYLLVQMTVSIWSFILLVLGVSEVHAFSIWKSLLNIVMAFAVGVALSWVVLTCLERILDLRV